MNDERLVYRRSASNPTSWLDFSAAHLAFVLHRITGWLLLGWVVIHLAIPSLRDSPVAVFVPSSDTVIVSLLAISIFHSFNGIRLLVAEFTGLGTQNTKRVFIGTLVVSIILIIGIGILL